MFYILNIVENRIVKTRDFINRQDAEWYLTMVYGAERYKYEVLEYKELFKAA